MKTYSTIDGDVLDDICLKYYGQTSDVVERVLDVNPLLAELGPVYSAGVKISLPDFPRLKVKKENVRLWD